MDAWMRACTHTPGTVGMMTVHAWLVLEATEEIATMVAMVPLRREVTMTGLIVVVVAGVVTGMAAEVAEDTVAHLRVGMTTGLRTEVEVGVVATAMVMHAATISCAGFNTSTTPRYSCFGWVRGSEWRRELTEEKEELRSLLHHVVFATNICQHEREGLCCLFFLFLLHSCTGIEAGITLHPKMPG